MTDESRRADRLALDLYGVLATVFDALDESDDAMQAARDATGWDLINQLVELQGAGEAVHTVASVGVLLFAGDGGEDDPIGLFRDCIAHWRLAFDSQGEIGP